MEFQVTLIKIVGLISEACCNMEKLPVAFISVGVVQASVALALTVFKAPSGILLHHGMAQIYLYYDILNPLSVSVFVSESSSIQVIGFPFLIRPA
jgi:hypothetical protein